MVRIRKDQGQQHLRDFQGHAVNFWQSVVFGFVLSSSGGLLFICLITYKIPFCQQTGESWGNEFHKLCAVWEPDGPFGSFSHSEGKFFRAGTSLLHRRHEICNRIVAVLSCLSWLPLTSPVYQLRGMKKSKHLSQPFFFFSSVSGNILGKALLFERIRPQRMCMGHEKYWSTVGDTSSICDLSSLQKGKEECVAFAMGSLECQMNMWVPPGAAENAKLSRWAPRYALNNMKHAMGSHCDKGEGWGRGAGCWN